MTRSLPHYANAPAMDNVGAEKQFRYNKANKAGMANCSYCIAAAGSDPTGYFLKDEAESLVSRIAEIAKDMLRAQ